MVTAGAMCKNGILIALTARRGKNATLIRETRELAPGLARELALDHYET